MSYCHWASSINFRGAERKSVRQEFKSLLAKNLEWIHYKHDGMQRLIGRQIKTDYSYARSWGLICRSSVHADLDQILQDRKSLCIEVNECEIVATIIFKD